MNTFVIQSSPFTWIALGMRVCGRQSTNTGNWDWEYWKKIWIDWRNLNASSWWGHNTLFADSPENRRNRTKLTFSERGNLPKSGNVRSGLVFFSDRFGPEGGRRWLAIPHFAGYFFPFLGMTVRILLWKCTAQARTQTHIQKSGSIFLDGWILAGVGHPRYLQDPSHYTCVSRDLTPKMLMYGVLSSDWF